MERTIKEVVILKNHDDGEIVDLYENTKNIKTDDIPSCYDFFEKKYGEDFEYDWNEYEKECLLPLGLVKVSYMSTYC